MVEEVSAELETHGYPIGLTNQVNLEIKIYEGKNYVGSVGLTRAGIVWKPTQAQYSRPIPYSDLKKLAETL
jgi:hypothetical protein